MYSYNAEKTESDLDPLPAFVDQYDDVTILEGNPEQSGRVDFHTAEGSVLAGVWECTRGKFEITYPFSEIATILNGTIVVTDSAGVATTLTQGDSFFIAQGERVTWEVVEDMRKSFFLHTEQQESARAAAG